MDVAGIVRAPGGGVQVRHDGRYCPPCLGSAVGSICSEKPDSSPRQVVRKAVAATLRTILNAPRKTEAERLWKPPWCLAKEQCTPAGWTEEVIPENLTVFYSPAAHRVRLHSSPEDINRLLRWRTRLTNALPKPDAPG